MEKVQRLNGFGSERWLFITAKVNLNEGLRYSLVPGDGRKPLSDKYSERGGVNDGAQDIYLKNL
jgi:hypothetical protein|uniref:Uncharacterized protein n=1 Tax=viral metagenome TaxID=1070528 RepID=A0A6C0BJD1_9ZZZZ